MQEKLPKSVKSSLQKENHFLSKFIPFFRYWQMNIFLKLRNVRWPFFSSIVTVCKLQCNCLKYHPKVYRSRKKYLGWTYFPTWPGHKSLLTRDCYRTFCGVWCIGKKRFPKFGTIKVSLRKRCPSVTWECDPTITSVYGTISSMIFFCGFLFCCNIWYSSPQWK